MRPVNSVKISKQFLELHVENLKWYNFVFGIMKIVKFLSFNWIPFDLLLISVCTLTSYVFFCQCGKLKNKVYTTHRLQGMRGI